MRSLGLVQRRQLWVPTFRGWALLALFLGLLAAGLLMWTEPFLGPTRPIGGDILVVEGWLPDYALEQAKQTFESRPYRVLVVTGVPIDLGYHISKEKNYAQLGATTLQLLGLNPEQVVAVPSPEVRRDRTYATACQLKAWLENGSKGRKLDVFTLGVHARRTWILYGRALGEDYQVGIISGKDRTYDVHRWWSSSSGFRTVTSELIAYCYAKFLFHPPRVPS